LGFEIGCEFLTPEGKPLVERAPKAQAEPGKKAK
jgi:hypothetical protein